MKKKLYIVTAAVACLILLFAAYAAYTYTEDGFAPAYPNDVVSQSKEISAEELRAFLKTWNLYLAEGMDKVGYAQVSMTASSSLKEANPRVTAWLERKRWNADRFFYIEVRLRAIVSTIKKDEFIVRNNKMILEQAKNSNDADVSESLIKYADEQYKKLNVEKISAAERAMVTAQFDEIVNLLQGASSASDDEAI